MNRIRLVVTATLVAVAGSLIPSTVAWANPTTSLLIDGESDPGLTVFPADPAGAIGPTRYVEVVNDMMGIWNRAGTPLGEVSLADLTNVSNIELGPQIIWDPFTNRFYYTVVNADKSTIMWGFSKGPNPTTPLNDFCNYEADFGYFPLFSIDIAKLGDTMHALLLGVDLFVGDTPTIIRSDLLGITKPSGSGTFTTCPDESTFRESQAQNLIDGNGKRIKSPQPAVQTDARKTGWALGTPPTTPANHLAIFKVTEDATGLPLLPVQGTNFTIPIFTDPPDAPQAKTGGGNPTGINTGDGRLTSAVAGIDPGHGSVMAVWVCHAVAGGAGAEVRWYEINPATNAMIQSGVASSPSLWAFNGAIAPDRAVATGVTPRFGDSMVLGFTTSSASTFPAVQMVSKVAAAAQSPFKLVFTSPGDDQGWDCEGAHGCWWGRYASAAADPSPPIDKQRGMVWLANMTATGGGPNSSDTEWDTRAWAATP